MTFPDPLVIAAAHQKNIADMRRKITSDAICINQLLVGRKVYRKGHLTRIFTVTETRMNLTGVVEVRGKLDGKGRTTHIGVVAEIVEATKETAPCDP